LLFFVIDDGFQEEAESKAILFFLYHVTQMINEELINKAAVRRKTTHYHVSHEEIFEDLVPYQRSSYLLIF